MKTRSLMPLKASLLTVILAAATAPTQAGVVILNFGSPTYVIGGDAHLQGDTGTYLGGSDKYGEPVGYPIPTTLVGRAYSNSQAFSPTSGYSGPSFLGGGSVTSSNPNTTEGFHDLSVANGGSSSGDSIHWTVDSNGTDTHSKHVFILFPKNQFDPSWSSIGTITDTELASSTFLMHTGQVVMAGPTDITNRWVVQDGSDFWVSQNLVSLTNNANFQTNFSSITGWAPYNPSSGLAALDFDESSTFLPRSFSDVQGLGFYVEHENGSNQTHVDISIFNVSVPEPAQLSFTATGLGLLLMRRRRH